MRARHKFHAKPTSYEGMSFASQLEFSYFMKLELEKKAGHVLFYLRQVPFHLPGGKYVCDFQVFYSDGSVAFIDVKGMMTPMCTFKIKSVEELYPIKIKIIRRGEF